MTWQPYLATIWVFWSQTIALFEKEIEVKIEHCSFISECAKESKSWLIQPWTKNDLQINDSFKLFSKNAQKQFRLIRFLSLTHWLRWRWSSSVNTNFYLVFFTHNSVLSLHKTWNNYDQLFKCEKYEQLFKKNFITLLFLSKKSVIGLEQYQSD